MRARHRTRAPGSTRRTRRRSPIEFSSSCNPVLPGESRCAADAGADHDRDEERGADGLRAHSPTQVVPHERSAAACGRPRRRVSAEAVGTALSSRSWSVPASRAAALSGQRRLQLLENSIATGAGLVALILALGPVSGAHFNPVVTLADRLLGGIPTPSRRLHGRAGRRALRWARCVANLMFDLPAVDVLDTTPLVRRPRLGEVVATFGLLLVILGVVRAGRAQPRRSRSAATSPPRTGSRRRRASPTLRSRSAGRSPTRSRASRPASVPDLRRLPGVGALLARRAGPVLEPDLAAGDLVVPHEHTDVGRTRDGPARAFRSP